MSLDLAPPGRAGGAMPDAVEEAGRQIRICNACRYCEGFCSVFPATTRQRHFTAGDLTHLANLCHNCRGCYYSCQYTAPHEFDLNLPTALGTLRQKSWEDFVRPRGLVRAFSHHGMAILALAVVAVTLIAAVAQSGPEGAGGASFYAFVPHWLMVSIFLPLFIAPLVVVGSALYRYWHATAGTTRPGWRGLGAAVWSTIWMRNLSGGDGQGCNFEREERPTHARRLAHQAVMYGFLLCFVATSVATIMDYGFGLPAPYPLFSAPRLLGLSGGILLVLGAAKLFVLKLQAERPLGAPGVWGGEMAFVVLLGLTGASGLLLSALDGGALTRGALVLHLGLVATFFVLIPYSKMIHGFFRLTALTLEAADRKG